MPAFEFRHAELLARQIHRCDAEGIAHAPAPRPAVEELCRAPIYDCELFRTTGRRGFKAFVSPLYGALGLELFECCTLKERTKTHAPLLAVVGALMRRRRDAGLSPAEPLWRVFRHHTTGEIVASQIEDDAFAVAFKFATYLNERLYFPMRPFQEQIFSLLHSYGARPDYNALGTFLSEERHESYPPAFAPDEIGRLWGMASQQVRTRALQTLCRDKHATVDPAIYARIEALPADDTLLHALAAGNVVPSPINPVRRAILPRLDAFAPDTEGRLAIALATAPAMRALLLSLMRAQHAREAPFVRVLLLARRRPPFACMPLDLFASIVKRRFGSFRNTETP